MKISVIMASYLGNYPNRAKNPEKKFIRAVNSFKKQTYQDKELIIVADGCDKTVELYNQYFSEDNNIQCIKIDKQPIYGSEVRNTGLKNATGELICYLDNDDVIGKKHLQILVDSFDNKKDFAYFNDYLVLTSDFKKLKKRNVEPRYGSIGTSSIIHKNFYKNNIYKYRPTWYSSYGHDWLFIISMAGSSMKFYKLKNVPQYLVCHWGGQADF